MKEGINVSKNAILREAVDSCNLQKVEEALKEATLDNINHRVHHSYQGWSYNSTLLDDAIIDQDCPDSIANTLIEHGADAYIKGEYGRTSLINAIVHKKDSITQKIINVTLSEGAKRKLPEESVNEYISKKISVKDNGGKSALHYSLYYERFEITQTLLRYHAKVEKKDIELARLKKKEQIAELLEKEFYAQRGTTEATILSTTEPDIESTMEWIRNTNRSNGTFDLRNDTIENTTTAIISRGATQNIPVISNSSDSNQIDVLLTQDYGNGSTAGIIASIAAVIAAAVIVSCCVAKRLYNSRIHDISYQRTRDSFAEKDRLSSTLCLPRSQRINQPNARETIL